MTSSVERERVACTYCHSSQFCPTCNGEGHTWLYFTDRSGRERVTCDDCMGSGYCQACAVRAEIILISRNGTT